MDSPSKEVPPICLPVIQKNLFNGSFPDSKDGQPCKHSPYAIFLSDVITSSTIDKKLEFQIVMLLGLKRKKEKVEKRKIRKSEMLLNLHDYLLKA